MNTLTLYNFYYYTNFYHFTRTCSRGEWNFFDFQNGHAGLCIYLYG
jgi:hypothetical protein